MNKTSCSILFNVLAAAAISVLAAGCNHDEDGADADTMLELPDLVERAYVFRVFKREENVDAHDRAIIALVKTATHADESMDRYGLLFFQRNASSGKAGQGMLCPVAERVNKSNGTPDVALSCSQCVGETQEILTVGRLDSEFCQTLDEDPNKAVANEQECRDNVSGRPKTCVCYDIEHAVITDMGTQCPNGALTPASAGYAPPDRGSGSGGRGG